MGKPKNVMSMSVSVPRTLKATMKKKKGVNWSAVATAAFEAVCYEQDQSEVVRRQALMIIRSRLALDTVRKVANRALEQIVDRGY